MEPLNLPTNLEVYRKSDHMCRPMAIEDLKKLRSLQRAPNQKTQGKMIQVFKNQNIAYIVCSKFYLLHSVFGGTYIRRTAGNQCNVILKMNSLYSSIKSW